MVEDKVSLVVAVSVEVGTEDVMLVGDDVDCVVVVGVVIVVVDVLVVAHGSGHGLGQGSVPKENIFYPQRIILTNNVNYPSSNTLKYYQ